MWSSRRVAGALVAGSDATGPAPPWRRDLDQLRLGPEPHPISAEVWVGLGASERAGADGTLLTHRSRAAGSYNGSRQTTQSKKKSQQMWLVKTRASADDGPVLGSEADAGVRSVHVLLVPPRKGRCWGVVGGPDGRSGPYRLLWLSCLTDALSVGEPLEVGAQRVCF